MSEKEIEYHRDIAFKDAAKTVVKIEIEIKDGTLAMSGEYGGGSCGQMLDHIEPKNDAQKKLIELWNQWHLNDMRAGTKKQQAALAKWKAEGHSCEYYEACAYLASLNPDGTPISLLDALAQIERITAIKTKIKHHQDTIRILNTKHEELKKKFTDWIIIPELDIKEFADTGVQQHFFFKNQVVDKWHKIKELQKQLDDEHAKTLLYDYREDTGKLHQYGNAWLKEELPDDIKTLLDEICDEIDKITEEERTGRDVKDAYANGSLKTEGAPAEELEDYDAEEIALALHLNLTIDQMEEIEETGSNNYEYGGTEYFVGTQEEAEDAAREYLEDDDGYLWKSAVEAGNTTQGLDDWIQEVIDSDGVGSILNSWNGTEENIEVDGTEYVIIRRS